MLPGHWVFSHLMGSNVIVHGQGAADGTGCFGDPIVGHRLSGMVSRAAVLGQCGGGSLKVTRNRSLRVFPVEH